MKVTSDKDLQKEFKPFSINIQFENETEVLEFFAMVNYSPITDNLPSVNESAIREQLKANYPELKSKYRDRFQKFMRDLERRIKGF